jgi:hypothetical protein
MTPKSETGTKFPNDIGNRNTPIRPERIDPGRSVIVVSDLHLGGTEDPHTSARFSRFLEYVSGLYPGRRQAPDYDQTPDTLNLLPPQKFILLGDFFDLWDPRCSDRNNVLLEAMIPIARLGQMDCDVIFVTGNHDEDIGELVDLQRRIENIVESDPCRKEPDPCEKGTSTSGQETAQHPERSIRYVPPVKEDSNDAGVDFRTRPGRKFSVYKKSYIPGPGREGLDVGGVYYAFLHGHQFDLEQITYRFSEIIKKRFDPVNIIMDYANTGLAKSIALWQSILFLILFLVLLAASQFYRLGILFSIAVWILAFITVVISIPKIFAYAKREAYNRIKTRDKTVLQVIGKDDKEQRQYFRPQKFTLGANVVIFGHTHCAGKELYTIPINEKNPQAGKSIFLINSGGWVRVKSKKEPRPEEPSDPCKYHLDTFVYIDADWVRLLKWVEDEREGKPCSGRVEIISSVGRDSVLARTVQS